MAEVKFINKMVLMFRILLDLDIQEYQVDLGYGITIKPISTIYQELETYQLTYMEHILTCRLLKDLVLASAGTWNLDCPSNHTCDTNGRENMGCIFRAFLQMEYRWSTRSIQLVARAGAWNDKADESANASNKIRQYDLLLNWWLSPNAVLKVDYENQKYFSSGKGSAGYNFWNRLPILIYDLFPFNKIKLEMSILL